MKRSRYDQNTQRTIWVPSRPNKRSREEIAEIDGELIQRANRLRGSYRPIQEAENEPEQFEMEAQPAEERINNSESEGEREIIRGDNLPIVDLKTTTRRVKKHTTCKSTK